MFTNVLTLAEEFSHQSQHHRGLPDGYVDKHRPSAMFQPPTNVPDPASPLQKVLSLPPHIIVILSNYTFFLAQSQVNRQHTRICWVHRAKHTLRYSREASRITKAGQGRLIGYCRTLRRGIKVLENLQAPAFIYLIHNMWTQNLRQENPAIAELRSPTSEQSLNSSARWTSECSVMTNPSYANHKAWSIAGFVLLLTHAQNLLFGWATNITAKLMRVLFP